MDLVLNNLHRLICHKPVKQPTNQPINQKTAQTISFSKCVTTPPSHLPREKCDTRSF